MTVGSNPFRSTIQSLSSGIIRRIGENSRVCAGLSTEMDAENGQEEVLGRILAKVIRTRFRVVHIGGNFQAAVWPYSAGRGDDGSVPGKIPSRRAGVNDRN